MVAIESFHRSLFQFFVCDLCAYQSVCFATSDKMGFAMFCRSIEASFEFHGRTRNSFTLLQCSLSDAKLQGHNNSHFAGGAFSAVSQDP